MHRSILACLLTLFPVCALLAQEGPQRGTIKKLDRETGTITISAAGKDHELIVTGRTRFMAANGEAIEMGLKDERLKDGTAVMFRTEERDGHVLLVRLRLSDDSRRQGGDIRRGKIAKLNLEKMTITIAADGKEHELALNEETQVLGAAGNDLRERLKDFKEGSDLFFQAELRDGKAVARGLKLADSPARSRPATRPSISKADTPKLKALTELGASEYAGFKGGLYPDGKNERPPAHQAAGAELARSVRPLDAEGQPHADGSIVLLSIGMSNATQEFSAFKRIADSDREKNPQLVIVDGAQGGMTAAVIRNPDDSARGAQYWSTVDQRLSTARVSREQVQAVWIKEADAGPTQGFPGYAQTLQQELGDIARLLHARFPNLKLAYLSCRTYGGYASTPLNPEPYAYESGFAVKWLIDQQIRGEPSLNFDPVLGDTKAPWLSWGPYLWANGTRPNPDGLQYEESDFAGDGTHPSQSGQRKVAQMLLRFFKTDSTTRPWFVAIASKQSSSEGMPPSQTKLAASPAETEAVSLFQFFDRNHDGSITRQELEDAVRLFDKLDRNEDGLLDRRELIQSTRRQGRPGEIVTKAAKGERYDDVLEVGDEAPDFTLPDPERKMFVTLSSFRGQRPVVLVFTSFT